MKLELIKGKRKVNADPWIWCCHCERVYRSSERVESDELLFCPYPDCDGDGIFDAWDYEEHRVRHWPDVPVIGCVYHLYE